MTKVSRGVGIVGASALVFALGPRRAFAQAETLSDILAPSQSGGLTADEVATRAKETSYDVAARRQAFAITEAQLNQALVAYFPKLNVVATYTRLSPVTQPAIAFPTGGSSASFAFPVFLDNFIVQAGLSIPITDYVLRLSQGYAAASRNKRAALLDEQASRLKVATDAKDTYYAWLRAKGQTTVAEKAVQQAQAHLVDARNAFDAGSSSKADVMGVESQLASSQLVLARAVDLAQFTEGQLRTIMHDPSQAPYLVGEDLREDLPPLAARNDLATLRAEALAHRLEIRALDETAWSFREQAAVAKAGYYPRLDAFGDFILANPNPRVIPQINSFAPTWDVGVRVTWTINDSVSAVNTVSQNRARADQTEAQRWALSDAVGLEVLSTYQAEREAEFAVETTQRGLAAAAESYRVRRELFRNGRATSVELTDAEVALFRAGLEAINARADLRSSRAKLMHAVGRDIPPGIIGP